MSDKTIMVQADLTDREFDLVVMLVEEAIDELLMTEAVGLIRKGTILFTAEEVDLLYDKLNTTEMRLTNKLIEKGLMKPEPDEAEMNEAFEHDPSLWLGREEYD